MFPILDGLFNNVLFDIVVETKPVITSDLLKDTPIVFALPPVEKVEKGKSKAFFSSYLNRIETNSLH